MNFDGIKMSFKSNYQFFGLSQIIRSLSDKYSSQFCDRQEAQEYAEIKTNGRCLYCGKQLCWVDEDGKFQHSNDLHWDHIMPASRFNLFTKGNVAIACSRCNLDKNSTDAIDFFKEKQADDLETMFETEEEFSAFLDDYMQPYREDFPEYFEVGSLDLSGKDVKFFINTLFLNRIDTTMSYCGMKYRYKISINSSFYKDVKKKIINKGLAKATSKDIMCRIGYFNDTLEEMYPNTLIKDLTSQQLENLYVDILKRHLWSKKNYSIFNRLIKHISDVCFDEYNIVPILPTKDEVKLIV